MKSERLVVGLTALNLVLLLFLLGWASRTSTAIAATSSQALLSPAAEVVPVLRGRAFELVDETGQAGPASTSSRTARSCSG